MANLWQKHIKKRSQIATFYTGGTCLAIGGGTMLGLKQGFSPASFPVILLLVVPSFVIDIKADGLEGGIIQLRRNGDRLVPADPDRAEGFRDQESVPASEGPCAVHGDIDRDNRGAGELGHPDDAGLDEAARAARAVQGMNGSGMDRKLCDHRGKCLVAAAGAGAADGAEVQPPADIRNQVTVPALADHRCRGEFAETSGITDDEEYPLVPDGDDPLPALTEMVK